jgi:hypothetical protein
MAEKPCTKIDEIRYYRENFEDLKKQFPESEAKRKAIIDFPIIFLLFEDAFYNGKFHFYEQWKIAQQFRKFRPDLAVTDDEISYSVKRCTDRKRLYGREFMNDFSKLVMKFVYNANYWQPPEKSTGSQNAPTYSSPSFGEPNPFEADEFKQMQDEIDRL